MYRCETGSRSVSGKKNYDTYDKMQHKGRPLKGYNQAESIAMKAEVGEPLSFEFKSPTQKSYFKRKVFPNFGVFGVEFDAFWGMDMPSDCRPEVEIVKTKGFSNANNKIEKLQIEIAKNLSRNGIFAGFKNLFKSPRELGKSSRRASAAVLWSYDFCKSFDTRMARLEELKNLNEIEYIVNTKDLLEVDRRTLDAEQLRRVWSTMLLYHSGKVIRIGENPKTTEHIFGLSMSANILRAATAKMNLSLNEFVALMNLLIPTVKTSPEKNSELKKVNEDMTVRETLMLDHYNEVFDCKESSYLIRGIRNSYNPLIKFIENNNL